MELTQHYGLKKPGLEDPVRVADFNENADAIDEALHSLETGGASSGLQMDLLWENASPASEFAEQTVALDLSGYDCILAEVNESTENSTNVDCVFALKNGTQNAARAPGASRFIVRYVSCNDGGVTFSRGFYADSYGVAFGARNFCLIPNKVFGIKGVINNV